MARFLHLGFTFPDGLPKTAELEPVMNFLSEDWIRYSPYCWIVWSSRPASDYLYAVKPLLGPRDTVLIVGLKMEDRNGWEPQSVWEWIDRKRQLGPPPPPTPPPSDLPTGLLGFGGLGRSSFFGDSLVGLLNPPKDEPKK